MSGPSEKQFSNAVVLVTGAASGMGLETAKLFGARGAKVVVNDLDHARADAAAKQIRARGGQAMAHAADVTDAPAVNTMVERVRREFGAVDVLVNNAGILRSTRFLAITPDEWDLVVNVNLKAAFLVSQAVARDMVTRKKGKIVNISSMAGRATSTLGGAPYTAAKAGLLGLSRHLARELAPHQINVNAICPGIVDTAMIKTAMDSETTDRVMGTIPFGRLADPVEVAQLAAFLASSEASYITGASVDIHGGEIIIA